MQLASLLNNPCNYPNWPTKSKSDVRTQLMSIISTLAGDSTSHETPTSSSPGWHESSELQSLGTAYVCAPLFSSLTDSCFRSDGLVFCETVELVEAESWTILKAETVSIWRCGGDQFLRCGSQIVR